MTLISIIKHLCHEHDLVFIENKQKKDVTQLNFTDLLVKTLIAHADKNYLYVFDSSLTKSSSNHQYDLMQILFIYDALLNLADDNVVDVDRILGENNHG
ncbi:hypothetical protein [Caedibacter taeniospiralis]|jgi:hypothetical protein|uniref:hypothetical protein n=1 Tax=Caedibacter taeniospiralis TaxID=28907 RepID=UPI000C27958A|nr:hypothetical protein [Caedibacter taeniospiralis]